MTILSTQKIDESKEKILKYEKYDDYETYVLMKKF